MINLRYYQEEAVEKLKNGSILCGAVGSGKSRTALAYYYTKVCKGELPINGEGWYSPMQTPKDLYIITTARKRDTLEWQGECTYFLLSDDRDISEGHTQLTVDSWNNIGKYTDVENAFFIFDEQRLVGSGAWVKSFYKIAKKNEWILLSATPGDTWMDYIPVFVANGFYKNRTEFLREHVIFNRWCKYPKVDQYVNIEKMIAHKDDILVDMEYTRPSNVKHVNIEVGYNKEDYDYALNNRWNVIDNCPAHDAGDMCRILRKIVNSSPSRLEATRNLIFANPKVIIFYNFDYELEILRYLCQLNTICYGEWNGHNHNPIPKSDKWVYLVQYSAGSEGWNCIETNVILFYSASYSYKAMVQAAGRIDRMNTPFKELFCYHLVSNSSIDRAIEQCLENKRDFNEKMFVGA